MPIILIRPKWRGTLTNRQRLSRQGGLVAPKMEDWRAMKDSIMIAPVYNGEVFNIVLADIPEKKTDRMSGKYWLPAP